MSALAGVMARDTGEPLADLLNAEAARHNLPPELPLALAIAESEVSVRAQRWGRHTAAALAALTADDRGALADLVAAVERETPGDISFGLFQQTVRWADEGDHSTSLENIFAIRDLYFEPGYATAVAVGELGLYWRRHGDALEALCRYNKPSVPGADNPHRGRYLDSLERARGYLTAQEPAMPLIVDVKRSPHFSSNRPKTLGVVLHSTRGGTASAATDYEATINWFVNPNSQVSAHVVIGPQRVCRMVDDADQAWHAEEHNATHLGMEIAQPKIDTPFSDFQYEAAAILVREWCAKYNLPLKHVTDSSERGMIGHEETAQGRRVGKTDPGPRFDWPRFVSLLVEGSALPARIAELRNALGFVTGFVADRLQQALDGARAATSDAAWAPAHDALQAAVNTLRGEASMPRRRPASSPTRRTSSCRCGTSPASWPTNYSARSTRPPRLPPTARVRKRMARCRPLSTSCAAITDLRTPTHPECARGRMQSEAAPPSVRARWSRRGRAPSRRRSPRRMATPPANSSARAAPASSARVRSVSPRRIAMALIPPAIAKITPLAGCASTG